MLRRTLPIDRRLLWALAGVVALFALLGGSGFFPSAVPSHEVVAPSHLAERPAGAGAARHVGVPLPPTASTARPFSYAKHYYAGVQYSGVNTSATQLTVKITVPDAIPSSGEFYYVLLSVWDSAGSYDQVGFSNDRGVWGWTTSFTSYCAATYNYSADRLALSPGATYSFSMNLSNGNVTYAVASGHHYLGSVTGHTGASSFVQTGWYTCSGTTWYNYENYEEVWYTVQKVPSFGFEFDLNRANNTTVTAWVPDISLHVGERVGIHGSRVRIDNEWFSLSFHGGSSSVRIHRGSSYASNLSLSKLFGSGNVTLTWFGTSGTISVTLPSGPIGVPSTAAFNVSVGLHLMTAIYTLNLVATDANGVFTFVTLSITVT